MDAVIIAIYTFTLFWIYYAIVKRNFTKPDWEAALPGLDRTPALAFTMWAHIVCGAISLLLGPLQLISYIRRQIPYLHRWSGRVCCICCMLSTIFGLMFIALKGKLVGGWNKSIAFSVAGIVFGFLAAKTWHKARLAKFFASDRERYLTSHRNWAIRSYSQILAPVLYRYWYTVLAAFNWYPVPKPLKFGEVCNSDDTCPDYYRWLDSLHCWTYWLSSLLIAGVIVHYLPPLGGHK